MPQAGVASGNRDTAAAAVSVLRGGGNAVDAVVAAGFAASVSEPGLTSLGGGGFLLLAPPAGNAAAAPTLVDFFVDVPGRGSPPTRRQGRMVPITVHFPGADQVFHAGWGSVAVPGCLAGYLRVQQQHGRLPMADVVEPARRLAADGVRLDPAQAAVLDLLRDIATLTPEGRRVFAPDGRLLRAGETLRNPELADFLDDLAAGRVRSLGDVADPLDQAMQAGGGLVTAMDLDAYAVVDRTPLRLRYRGGEVLSNPPPSFGARLVLDALGELADQAPLDETPAAYERFARQVVGIADRRVSGPVALRGTTHISVIDADGMAVAMTTSNGSCSGTFVPGAGIQLNNMLGESDLHPSGLGTGTPGQRVGSMMMPTVVRSEDGTVVALGSGGSERIPSAMARALSGVLDLGWPLERVITSPRLHWDGTELQVEPGLPADVLAQLRSIWPVHEWEQPNLYFGGAHAVARRPDGTVEAVGDPRRGGTAIVVEV